MKRFFVLILCLLILSSSYAYAEPIKFRDMDWGINPYTFENNLAEEKIVWIPSEYTFSNDYSFLDYKLTSSYAVNPKWNFDEFPHYHRYIKKPECKVAGYELYAISAEFIPSFDNQGLLQTDIGNAQLFKASYVIMNFSNGKYHTSSDAFENLKIKLSEIYGTYTTTKDELGDVVFWKGDDSTSVALCFYPGGLYGNVIQIQYYSGVTRDSAQAIMTAY